jgi:hypothetical protein
MHRILTRAHTHTHIQRGLSPSLSEERETEERLAREARGEVGVGECGFPPSLSRERENRGISGEWGAGERPLPHALPPFFISQATETKRQPGGWGAGGANGRECVRSERGVCVQRERGTDMAQPSSTIPPFESPHGCPNRAESPRDSRFAIRSYIYIYHRRCRRIASRFAIRSTLSLPPPCYCLLHPSDINT